MEQKQRVQNQIVVQKKNSLRRKSNKMNDRGYNQEYQSANDSHQSLDNSKSQQEIELQDMSVREDDNGGNNYKSLGLGGYEDDDESYENTQRDVSQ